MREIKFRFFSKGENKMYQLTLLPVGGGDDSPVYVGANVWDEYLGMSRVQHVSDGNLMQYIGLKDENGVEIYEGDIVSVHDSHDEREFKGVVDFQDCSFVVKNDCVTHYRWMDYEVEVIGNVHENGGMINGEQ